MISSDLERLLPNKWTLKRKRISLYKLVSTSTSEDRVSPGQIRNENLQWIGRDLNPSTCKNTRLALLCRKTTCSVLLQSPMKMLRKGPRTIIWFIDLSHWWSLELQNLIYQKIRCVLKYNPIKMTSIISLFNLLDNVEWRERTWLSYQSQTYTRYPSWKHNMKIQTGLGSKSWYCLHVSYTHTESQLTILSPFSFLLCGK